MSKLDISWLFRADGWKNILTGLGISGKDKRVATYIDWERLDKTSVENLYAQDDIAACIVDVLPEDALRETPQIEGLGEKELAYLQSEMERLGAWEKIEFGWKWGRLYGGSLLVAMTDEVDDLRIPLNPSNVGNIKSLLELNRWETSVSQFIDDAYNPLFGYPYIYPLQPRTNGSAPTLEVHYSRVTRFDGVILPTDLAIQNQMWGDSVLTRVINALANFNTSYDSAAQAMQDFRINIFKIANLSQLLANGKDDLIQKRLGLVNLTKSIAKSIVIETGEEYTSNETTFTGVKDVLDKMKERLQTAARIPRTKLFGESPQGMGGTGRHEEVMWYDYVSSQQQSYLDPKLTEIINLIFAQKTSVTKGKIPEYRIEYPSLWQLDEVETVNMRKTQADIDKTYVDMGVLTQEEVRDSRFNEVEGYSIETKLGTAPDLTVE